MGQPVRQSSFRGEVTPEFYGRTSDPRYGVSLRTCKNFLCLVHGAMVNRAGTAFIAHTKNDAVSRLVSFIFSDGQSFVLEFTDTAVRFYTNGGQVLNAGVPYEVVSPYLLADLQRLKSAQGGDVVTICHPSYQPRELSRLSNTNWVFSLVTFTPPAGFVPQTLAFTALNRGGTNATAYNAANAYNAGQYVNDGTQTYIALVPSLAKTPSTSPLYWAQAIDALHQAKDWSVVVTALYKDSLGHELETLASASLDDFYVRSSDRPVNYQWGAPANPGFSYKLMGYSVYIGRNGVRGWLGDTDANTTTFKDDGSAPDFGTQPPKGTNPFTVADGNNTANTTKWPGAVTIHDQRRVFMRSDARPDYFFGSMIGNLNRFDVNDLPQAADAYNWRVSSQKLQEIRSGVSFDKLCLFAGQGEFAADGPNSGAITPNAVNVRESGDNGSSYLDPLKTEHAILFNTAKGNAVRDFAFDFAAGKFTGVELSDIARHFFKGRKIVSWAHCRVPHHLVWIALDNGGLLSLTYDRGTQTIAWAQHQTDGLVEQVCSVPEGNEDVLYLVVNRTGGRFVERMASRDYIPDTRLACFLDASLTYDGRNVGVVTMAVFGGSAGEDVVTVVANAPTFAVTDIGSQIVMCPDGQTVLNGDGTVNRVVKAARVTITDFTSNLQVTGILEDTLDVLFQSTPTTAWGWARKTITNLGHLEGKTVNVLADGAVQGPFVVAGGQIGVLDLPALIAVVGLAYVSDAELLDLPSDALKPNVKAVAQVTVEVVASSDVKAGEDFDHLRKQGLRRVSDGFGAPVPTTDQIAIATDSSWNTGGRACVRQDDPLPLTITGVIRDVVVGGRS